MIQSLYIPPSMRAEFLTPIHSTGTLPLPHYLPLTTLAMLKPPPTILRNESADPLFIHVGITGRRDNNAGKRQLYVHPTSHSSPTFTNPFSSSPAEESVYSLFSETFHSAEVSIYPSTPLLPVKLKRVHVLPPISGGPNKRAAGERRHPGSTLSSPTPDIYANSAERNAHPLSP